jgi:hypothetical protein
MFRKLLGVIAIVACLAGSALAQGIPASMVDRCQTGLKQTVDFNISTATTTSIIAPITGANIYICAYDINQAGGTGTVSIEYGTGATCGTGTVVLAGPYTANSSAGTTTNIAHANVGYTQMLTGTITAGVPTLVPSQRLCILSTGTIVQAGYLTFVQE